MLPLLVGGLLAVGQPSPPPDLPATAQPQPAADQPACAICQESRDRFLNRLCKAYVEEFKGKKGDNDKKDCESNNGDQAKSNNSDQANGGGNGNGGQNNANGEKSAEPEKPRRALPAPFTSPPFPTAEWQGFPLIGVPPSDTVYPLMKAIYGGSHGDAIKQSGIQAYGWINASGNWSTSNVSNTPSSYWVAANRVELDQFVFRLERQMDTVQTSRLDWGFRSTIDYGIDYR